MHAATHRTTRPWPRGDSRAAGAALTTTGHPYGRLTALTLTRGDPFRRSIPMAKPIRMVVATAILTLFAAGCGSGFDEPPATQATGKADLKILIGSSGDAETNAVKDAAAQWA